jgi:CheY-like chemotaxis protein
MATSQDNVQELAQARLRARHADGDWRSFEFSARSVPGPDRKPLFVIEARDMKGGEPRLPPAPAMQIGGPFAPPADLVSTGEFPACGEPAGPEGAADAELIERAGARGETVLVVLDDPKVSAQACSIMRSLGYNVLEAMSPADAEGFARVHRGAMDLLVADLATPRVRGRAFVRSMQAIRPGLKSLFVSCQRYGSLAERRVFESGARLLHEPFTPEELAHAVRRALEDCKH